MQKSNLNGKIFQKLEYFNNLLKSTKAKKYTKAKK